MFDEFYKALDKDLKDANLLDYNFEGVDLKKYDLTKAKISSAIMIKLGSYDDKLFRVITRDKQLSNITPST